MGFWTLLQILAHVVTFASLVSVFFSLRRPAKDDPRMSRGLQLLQSKIAVLEDLSDRTDTQVHQLQALLSQRSKDVETLIQRLDLEMAKIQQATQKSLEVAEIFQDRIPHKEIIERQTTSKYVKAAQLAHAGKSVDEIARSVDLSVGEIELIAKMNREHLQFSEAALPEWIQKSNSIHESSVTKDSGLASKDESVAEVEEAPLLKETPQALAQMGERMRKALRSGESDLSTHPAEVLSTQAEAVEKPEAQAQVSPVKPYSFPRVSIRDSLA
ncbi:MAG: DUF2802 domain-containing protein [Bdellovibrio sp.]